MSKINDTSRELTEAELDTVSGGSFGSVIGHIVHNVASVANVVSVEALIPEAA